MHKHPEPNDMKSESNHSMSFMVDLTILLTSITVLLCRSWFRAMWSSTLVHMFLQLAIKTIANSSNAPTPRSTP